MKKKTGRFHSARRSARVGVATASLVMASAPAALAQAPSCSVSGGVCTIPPGNYGLPYQTQVNLSTPLTFSNNGTLNVFTPQTMSLFGALVRVSLGANGVDVNGGNGGNAALVGSLIFQNAGSIAQSIGNEALQGGVANSVYGASIGGRGGIYTGTDGKHDGGLPTSGAAASLTNSGGVNVSISGSVGPSLFSGAAVLVESIGGNGGNVTATGTDGNGNPTYHTANGQAGAGGSTATLMNTGAVNAFSGTNNTPPLVSVGYWGIGARSLGGNGGTGNNGTAGGGAGAASVTTTADVNVRASWAQSIDGAPSTATPGIFAVHARSEGGNGNMSVNSGNDGGNGGNGGASSVTVAPASGAPNSTRINISLSTSNPSGLSTNPLSSAVAAFSLGGNGGAGYDSSTGGTGGSAGTVSVGVTSSAISASGDRTLGILGLARGGVGGGSGIGQDHSLSGPGGSTGYHTDITPSVQVSVTSSQVTTSGALSAGVTGLSLGGIGGPGTTYTSSLNPDGEAAGGGGGGNTGPVQVSVNGSSVQTTGVQSPGVVAVAQGGAGGKGGDLNAFAGGSGTGGTGGQGAPVTLTIGAGTTITTSGGPSSTGANPSYGVYAASIGGQGGAGGDVNVDIAGGKGDGGYGGGGYNVGVSLASGASVTTRGTGASAVFAVSAGGAGGAAYNANAAGFVSTDGTGGSGGSSGAVAVTNAAALTTSGTDAHGILAQSIGGLSGNGANGAGAIYGATGGAGAAGATGSVSVTNTGPISTSGSGGIGIQAQSIGGGTGSGGSQNGSFVAFGGSSPAASPGGTVTVSNLGSITTRSDFALGILTQSIGGGGGNAGSASGVFNSVGGAGGAGGDGGAATVTLSAGSAITTLGRLAHGAVVQSIGGGGGNGGDANSAGVVATMAIGGTGGSGGKGGAVTMNVTGGSIALSGSNAIGIVAQSIGGGGGTGGTAYAVSGSLAFAAAHAVGGSGAIGGDGGSVTLGLSGLSLATGQSTAVNTNLNPVDAYGIVAQSIGGGGGIAGSATANAFAVGVPVPGTEGNTVAVSVASSTGGSGGSAGNGGPVSLTISGSSPTSNTVTTQGQGSHGVVLQSIGGGGGAGGDSSSLAMTLSYGRVLTEAGKYEPPADAQAPDGPNGFSVNIAVAHGGNGSSGGSGGSVTASIDGSTILTLGDYANAVLAQSIGGGGGNGGIGSSTTQALGSTRAVTLGLGLGGKGGAGGDGGSVRLTIGTQAVIQTYGASALGVVGQSIGGGGGTSQGGTINLGAAYTAGDGTTVTPSGNLAINLGRTGGSGGNGGMITTVMQGRVLTSGSDAAGVVLQSIGGGGGIGGSAGAEASSDNPISVLTRVREAINNPVEGNVPINFTGSLSIGGRGGGGGNGSSIAYSQAGSIATHGDWAHGLVAQSIGAGGGMGGLAASSSSAFGISSNISVGGGGGAGGAGGAISLTFAPGSSISTGATTSGGRTGYGAFGVLAQSIGGGGGTGVDGSTASMLDINVGSATGGFGGGGSSGSQVYVTGTTSVTTQGDVGVGMVLQSIGGGGGIGASGTSLSARAGLFNGSTQLHVGGTSGAPGSGGDVWIDNGAFSIRTSGANAFGILAQSIGGGGGFGFTPSLTSTVTNSVGGSAAQSGASQGGSVSLNLTGGSIQTSGMGAHGIVAQSIGGGGGIAGVPTGPASMTTVAGTVASTTGNANSGGVSIASSAPITTTGDFAYGILAQSIGGGGGLYVQNGTQVVAGSTSTSANLVGQVYITQTAPVTAAGANSVGIFAQAVGASGGGIVHVDVSAAIQGGSGAKGYGIWVDSPYAFNLVHVEAGGSVSALSGNAIQMTAGSVQNDGITTGSYAVTGFFNNFGRLNAGPSLNADLLLNTGTVLIGATEGYGISRVSNAFEQRSSGRLLLDADFVNRRSDILVVDGRADLAGRVRPLIVSVLPNIEIPFLIVNGPINGDVQGDQTTIFGYGVSRKGNTFSVSAISADFTPPGYDLARNTLAIASHLQAAWDAGGTPALGPLFALLGNIADAGGVIAYRAALRQISPDSSIAPGARVAAGAQAFANAAMSCPQFQGTTAMLVEGECVWARLTGRSAAQAGGDGLSSYLVTSTTWQTGGQWSLDNGWFLGGSLAYENSRVSAGDGLRGGRGNAGFGAVTMKYQTGSWLFSGAVFGGGGQFNGTRTITLPGFGSIARGSPTLSNVGAMARATYTIGQENFYLRPNVSLSVIHSGSSGYRESGAGALNLDVSSASATVGALTPALEVGGRVTLGNGMVTRLFASGGVSFLTDDAWTQKSRLTSAPAAAGAFDTTLRSGQVVGRVTAGAQVFATERMELRVQYDGEFTGGLTGHGGSLTAALRF